MEILQDMSKRNFAFLVENQCCVCQSDNHPCAPSPTEEIEMNLAVFGLVFCKWQKFMEHLIICFFIV